MAYDFLSASAHRLLVSAAPATAEPLTLACWFNANNVTATEGVFSLRDGAGNARWQLQSAGAVPGDPLQAISVDAAATTAASGANGIVAGQWHHGAGVFSASNARQAWLDGAFGPSNASAKTVSGVNEVRIGGSFNGRIAEAAIWRVALFQAEIEALAKGFSPRLIRPDALVFYAPLVRDLIDLRGGPLTNDNATPVVAHPRRYG